MFEARLKAAGAKGLAEFDSGPTLIALDGGRFTMGSPGEVLTERRWWDVEFPALHEPDGPPPWFTPMEWEEVRHDSPYNERPPHDVTVRPFALGKFAVTIDEWDACAADGFCRPSPAAMRPGGAPSGESGANRGRRPVVNISWYDVTGRDGSALGFLRWLNWKAVGDADARLYRLPTEAEWEFAARAGTMTRYHFGDDESALDDYAWHVLSRGGAPRPVGEKRPNDWGFHDVYGNVGEWVQDCWRYNYVGAPTDGSAARGCGGDDFCSAAAMRGFPAFPGGMGSAVRSSWPRDRSSSHLGFRVARTLPPNDAAELRESG